MTQPQKIWLTVCALILFALIYLLKPVLTPFAAAALLAYMGDPVVNLLMRLKLPRTFAVILVFAMIMLALLILIIFLVPLLGEQIQLFFQRIPNLINWLQTVAVPWLNANFNLNANLDIEDLKANLTQNLGQASVAANTIWRTVAHSSLALIGWILKLLLIPVVTFYLLRDWDVVLMHARHLLPRRVEPKVVAITKECNEVLGAFIRGQLLVMLALSIIYSIGLWCAGVDLALLIGTITGLLSIVPYLGVTIGLLSAAIAVLMQYHDWLHLAYVGVVFLIGHLAENLVLTPLLVGDRIGLHPVAVIFAVFVGGHLFGFFGVLLALPVAAIIMVLLRHARQSYLRSGIYN